MDVNSTEDKITFDSLPIAEPVLRGIQDAGFTHCTDIQGKTLPITLEGKDVAGQAQTGTGKTAAFLIATFSHLMRTPEKELKRPDWVAPRALIVAPTRELAIQIDRDAQVLGKYCNLRTVCIYGGVDYEKQRRQIQEGVDIMIVTPGRLIDYYKQKFFSLKSVEVLVIDEADRMFDMGFISDIRYILRNTTKYNQRLSMLYSATLNHRVMELCYEHMNDPVPIKIDPEKMVVDKVEQKLYHVGSHEKFSLLLGILDSEKGEKVLIFSNTKNTAEYLEAKLRYNGYEADQISGDLPQRVRMRVLTRFMEGDSNILIATDVASRGLHIDAISHVINYDLPQDSEDYIHRIGRTARAGESGDAISLACEDYAEHLVRIEEALKMKIPVEWPEDNMFFEEKPGGPERKEPRPPRTFKPREGGRPRHGGGRRDGGGRYGNQRRSNTRGSRQQGQGNRQGGNNRRGQGQSQNQREESGNRSNFNQRGNERSGSHSQNRPKSSRHGNQRRSGSSRSNPRRPSSRRPSGDSGNR